MTVTEFREKLAKAQEALEKVPGDWTIETVMLKDIQGNDLGRIQIIADGPRTEDELREAFTGPWAWQVKRYKGVRVESWNAVHANGTQLKGEWWRRPST